MQEWPLDEAKLNAQRAKLKKIPSGKLREKPTAFDQKVGPLELGASFEL
jgi:hypothetical protein